MSGLGIARVLKGKAVMRSVPIVVLTGCVDEEHEATASSAGCAGFFTKPGDVRGLLGAVARYLSDA